MNNISDIKKNILGKIFYIRSSKKVGDINYPNLMRVINFDTNTDLYRCLNMDFSLYKNNEQYLMTETELIDNYVAIAPHGVIKLSSYTNSNHRMNVVMTISPYIRTCIEDTIQYKLNNFNVVVIDVMNDLTKHGFLSPYKTLYISSTNVNNKEDYIVDITDNSLVIKNPQLINDNGDNIKLIDSFCMYYYYYDDYKTMSFIKDCPYFRKYEDIIKSLIDYRLNRKISVEDRKCKPEEFLKKDLIFNSLITKSYDYLLSETIGVKYLNKETFYKIIGKDYPFSADGIVYMIDTANSDKQLEKKIESLMNYILNSEYNYFNPSATMIRFSDIDKDTMYSCLFDPINKSFNDIVEEAKIKGYNVLMINIEGTIPILFYYKEISLEKRLDKEIGLSKSEVSQFLANAKKN